MEGARRAFAARMAELRERAGISQRALAREVYVDHSLITRLESGARSADPELAERIGSLLGAPGELRALAEASRPAFRGGEKRRSGTTRPPGGSPPGRPVVNALPPSVSLLVDRKTECARIEAFLAPTGDRAGAARVCLITGMPGIGKTALAVEAAHRAGPRFEDGCLYIDLRGFAEQLEPVEPHDALALLLVGLGVPEQAVPPTTAGRVSLFRNETAHKRLLLVLDNAASSEQIGLLLPAAASCRVLVTSRRRLPALDDADVISLQALPADAAAALFSGVSRRPETRDGAVRRIVEACGGHPLAIRILAARCRADPSLTPVALAGKLADARDRMDRLEDGERSVAHAFDVSFALLPTGQQRLFALLGLHPPFPLEARAVAALADQSVPATERLLEQLYLAGLLEPSDPGWYRMHDLLARYAAQLAERSLSGPELRAAVRRLLDIGLLTCHEADQVITPHRYRVPLAAEPAHPAAARTFTSYKSAYSWFSASLDTLSALTETAYEHGFDEHCWQLAYSLRGILFLGRHWTQWERSHEAAAAAARRCGDIRALSMTLNNLGLLRSLQGRHREAEELLNEAIVRARSIGDVHAEFTARSHLAWLLHATGHFAQALREQSAALAFHESQASPRNIAIIKRDMASTEIELGFSEEAIKHLRDAADAFAALGLSLDATMTLNALGETVLKLGDHQAAEEYHEAALESAIRAGTAFERARAHLGLGRLAQLAGRPARARHQLTRALRLYAELRAIPEAEYVRSLLDAETPRALPDTEPRNG